MFIFFDVLARLRVALWDWEFVHYWRILWLFARRMWLLLLLVWLWPVMLLPPLSIFRREIPLRSVARNLSWLFCLAVSLLVPYINHTITRSLLVNTLPLSLRLRSLSSLFPEFIVMDARIEVEGCLVKLAFEKKSNFFKSELVGRLCGYFCKQELISCLRLGEKFAD